MSEAKYRVSIFYRHNGASPVPSKLRGLPPEVHSGTSATPWSLDNAIERSVQVPLVYICIRTYTCIMFSRCGGCAIRAAADGALRKANRIIERGIMSSADKIRIDLAFQPVFSTYGQKLVKAKSRNSHVLEN